MESATERRWPVQGARRGQRTWTYGPFSTLMERILLKPLSMMFWHSSMNSQRFPWKFSSSHTVILNWPICSICWVFMAAASPVGLYNLEWWEKWKRQQRVDGCDQRGIADIPPTLKSGDYYCFENPFLQRFCFILTALNQITFNFIPKVFFPPNFESVVAFVPLFSSVTSPHIRTWFCCRQLLLMKTTDLPNQPSKPVGTATLRMKWINMSVGQTRAHCCSIFLPVCPKLKGGWGANWRGFQWFYLYIFFF